MTIQAKHCEECGLSILDADCQHYKIIEAKISASEDSEYMDLEYVMKKNA